MGGTRSAGRCRSLNQIQSDVTSQSKSDERSTEKSLARAPLTGLVQHIQEDYRRKPQRNYSEVEVSRKIGRS